MNLSVFALTNKVAVVTGSGRGIGKAIALSFADVGADLVVVARTAAEIEAAAVEIRDRGRRALAVSADIRSADQVRNMIERTVAEFGKIDILVNNAGGTFSVPFLQMSEGAWDAVLRENLKGVFLCTKAVVDVMVKQKEGSIINISSLAGQVPYAKMAHYGAAKAGVINLTQTLAVELGPYNIRVNTILPGYIEVEWFSQMLEKHPRVRERRLQRVPLGRFGKPEDIAGAAIYLASEASSYITGACILVTGGLTFLMPDF